MTIEHLIVKIQAVLGGRSDMSEMQKRALALEYCRLCSEAESALEHCLALLRAGRDYPALQIAESASLLETINSLSFEESGQWRDYCIAAGLPYPSRFDDAQIKLLNSLYTRGVTQTHPLYRDYRRAMRMRKYSDALAVIKTIAKINSYDAEVRGEVNRLTRLMVKKGLEKLDEAMRKGDDELFFKEFEFVESNADFAGDSPVLARAREYNQKRTRQRDRAKCEKILADLPSLNPSSDWERVIEMVADFNALRGGEEFDKSALEAMDEAWKKASEIQEERLKAQHEAEARNLLAAELETPSGGGRAERMAKILKLKADSGVSLDVSLESRADAEVARLRREQKAALAARGAYAAAAAAVLCAAAWGGFSMWKSARTESAARERVAAIEKLKDYSVARKSMEEFEADFPELSRRSPFSERLSAIREDLNSRAAELERVAGLLKKVSAVDVDNAPTSEIALAAADIERLENAVSTMNRSDAVSVRNSVEECAEKFARSLDRRRKAVAASVSKLLGDFEKIVSRYETADLGDLAIENECDEILKKLEAPISDTTRFFKVGESEAAKYADLSARLQTLRQARGRYAMLAKSVSEAKSLAEYMSAANSIVQLGDGVPPKYLAGFALVVKNADELKNLFAFGLKGADFPLDEIYDGPFTKSVFTQDRLLTDVYKYSKTSQSSSGASDVYTRGPISEQTNSWSGGSEVLQQADEISLGGVVSKVLYRLQTLKDSSPRGEILVGGALSEESQAGRAALKTAAEKSTLAALSKIQRANVNPIYKLMVERAIFAKLAEDPVGSGLAYSPSAQKRKAEVEKAAEKFFPYSWIFEGRPRRQLVENQLYSGAADGDYAIEAANVRDAVIRAKENPPKYVGAADAEGKFSGSVSGAALAFSADGALARYAADQIKSAVLLPYSPVFDETVSVESALREKNE